MDVFKISVPNGIEVGTFDNTIVHNPSIIRWGIPVQFYLCWNENKKQNKTKNKQKNKKNKTKN